MPSTAVGGNGSWRNYWDQDSNSDSASFMTLRSLLNLTETNFSPLSMGIFMTIVKHRNVRFKHENSCKHLLLYKKPSQTLLMLLNSAGRTLRPREVMHFTQHCPLEMVMRQEPGKRGEKVVEKCSGLALPKIAVGLWTISSLWVQAPSLLSRGCIRYSPKPFPVLTLKGHCSLLCAAEAWPMTHNAMYSRRSNHVSSKSDSSTKRIYLSRTSQRCWPQHLLRKQSKGGRGEGPQNAESQPL